MADGTPRWTSQTAVNDDCLCHDLFVTLCGLQVPEHLQCPDVLSDSLSYSNYDEHQLAFYNAAYTWCKQAGIIEVIAKEEEDSRFGKGKKDNTKTTVFMNRLLGMNLEQQQIVFGYVSSCHCENSLLLFFSV
jgi:hypothetical protein